MGSHKCMIIILSLNSVIFYTAVDSTEKTYENSVQVCGWTVRFIAAADANARITLLRNFKIYMLFSCNVPFWAFTLVVQRYEMSFINTFIIYFSIILACVFSVVNISAFNRLT